ncbi:carbonic anhydrase 3 [Rhinolophus ferrumequinum]|uniref:Carbonic anhydrase 3 n=1 Tax=Rhinolophus ferrumequinum TaxID=59479 RepID=A0A7J7VDC5_RHIFE|nr:carbonic anhydrase 3 [Rhinolophus ferrumequinum]
MAKEWGYASHNGPDHWHEIYPIAKGDNQSPIELHTKDIKHDPSLLPWSASYDPGSCKTILNNGKTCRVVFDDTFDRSSKYDPLGRACGLAKCDYGTVAQ